MNQFGRSLKVYFVDAGSGVNALLWGKSSPILRAVPGNVRPASAAWWPSREAALDELPQMLAADVEVIEK